MREREKRENSRRERERRNRCRGDTENKMKRGSGITLSVLQSKSNTDVTLTNFFSLLFFAFRTLKREAKISHD